MCATAGVYMIRNLVNNKVYIGSSVDIADRWSIHRSDLGKHDHCNQHFQKAWYKYGSHNFSFEIIKELHFVEKGDELKKRHLIDNEQIYLDLYESYKKENGYNICRYAGSSLGYKHSEEAKMKMRGKKHTREHIEKNRLVHLGKHASAETKQKLSEIEKIIQNKPEIKQKIKEAKNKPGVRERFIESQKIAQNRPGVREKKSKSAKITSNLPEIKQRNREAHLGNIPWNKGKTNCISEAAREKMRANNVSKKEERRRAISEQQKGNKNWMGKKHSDETKKKISESGKVRKLKKERQLLIACLIKRINHVV
jgi:group I intron endonuclease